MPHRRDPAPTDVPCRPGRATPPDGHVVWLLSDPGEADVHLDLIERRLAEAGHGGVCRVANVFEVIHELLAFATSGPLRQVNVVGHGAPGYMRIGSPHHGEETLLDVRAGCFPALRQLAGHFTDDAEIRLLGCSVALVGVTGSGPLLQLTLAQTLGVTVSAPRGDVVHTDYGSAGFEPRDAPSEFMLRIDPDQPTIATQPSRIRREVGRTAREPYFREGELAQIQLRTPLASPAHPRAYGIEPRRTWAAPYARARLDAMARAVRFDRRWDALPLADATRWASISLVGRGHYEADLLEDQAAIRIYDRDGHPHVFDLDPSQYALVTKGKQR